MKAAAAAADVDCDALVWGEDALTCAIYQTSSGCQLCYVKFRYLRVSGFEVVNCDIKSV